MNYKIGEFGEPPIEKKRELYHEHREKMRANPGQWMLVKVVSLRGACGPTMTRFKRQGFEACTTKVHDGQFGLWVRWPDTDS